MDPPFRLTPEMGSFKLLVLRFVRAYIEQNGGSPSYGEIARALGGTNTTRVYAAVKTLTQQKLLLKTKGERGIALPDAYANAVRLLREAGYVVDEDVLHLRMGPVLRLPPADVPDDAGVTDERLPPRQPPAQDAQSPQKDASEDGVRTDGNRNPDRADADRGEGNARDRAA